MDKNAYKYTSQLIYIDSSRRNCPRSGMKLSVRWFYRSGWNFEREQTSFLVAFPRRRTRGARENEEQEERERERRRERRQADGMEFSNQLGIRLLG